MKRFFAILSVAVLTALPAFAGFQQIDLTQTTNGVGTVVAVANTNYYTAPAIALSGSRILCLQANFSCMGSNTGPINIRFATTTDAVRYNTNYFNWSIPANGATSVILTTNIDTGAILLWKLQQIENTNQNAGIVTNLILEGYTKSGQ